MTPDDRNLIETFVVSTQSGCLLTTPLDINRTSGISTHFPGNRLDAIIAAGWANRLGSSLFRLKYGLDAAVYPCVLRMYREIAFEVAHILAWPDDELTDLMAEFVLLAWLTERQIWTSGDLIERANVLRKLIDEEQRQTLAVMWGALH